MRKLGTHTFAGTSGKTYVMNAYPGDMRFNDFIPGVFVIGTGDGTILMVEESDNVDVALQKHPRREEFADAANRIFMYRNASKPVRESVVGDLKSVIAADKG